MSPREAASILGVQLPQLADCDIDAAFRRKVLAYHPDTGNGDATALDKAKKARDTLREFVAKGGHVACGRCGGKGTVPGKNYITRVVCPACNGRG